MDPVVRVPREERLHLEGDGYEFGAAAAISERARDVAAPTPEEFRRAVRHRRTARRSCRAWAALTVDLTSPLERIEDAVENTRCDPGSPIDELAAGTRRTPAREDHPPGRPAADHWFPIPGDVRRQTAQPT